MAALLMQCCQNRAYHNASQGSPQDPALPHLCSVPESYTLWPTNAARVLQVKCLQRADEDAFLDRVNMYSSFYVAIRKA